MPFFKTHRAFMKCFRKGYKLKRHAHQFYYPKEIIKNKFSLQEKEVKKEKWRFYKKALGFINSFDR